MSQMSSNLRVSTSIAFSEASRKVAEIIEGGRA